MPGTNPISLNSAVVDGVLVLAAVCRTQNSPRTGKH